MATIKGTSKNETLTGTGSPDSISGGSGNDILIGLAGDDTLDGGAGNDVLQGGVGNDTYAFTSPHTVIDEESNSDKEDLVKTALAVNLSSMFGDAIEHVTLTGSTSVSVVGNAADNELTGNSGANTLDGADGNDVLNGADGNDHLLGGLGDDVVLAGAGIDTLDGAEGNDSLDGGTGSDQILGGLGIDTLTGGSGNDVVNGGLNSDILSGGVGDDLLDGGIGNDAMSGGTGNDIYFVDDLNDSINEFASEGADEVRTTLSIYALGLSIENLTFTGSGDFEGTGSTFNNKIASGAGSDLLDGRDGNDTLNAGGGNDTLSGGAGNDSLLGGADTDVLTGGAGNDTMDGGTGKDAMTGGAGSDIYIVDDASDSVSELASEGIDAVRTTLASYGLTANVENLSFVGTGDFKGTGNPINNKLIGGAGNNTLDGGDGNDTLNGAIGNDVLIGGASKDVLIGDAGKDSLDGGVSNDNLDAGSDDDTLIGGLGNDVINGGLGEDTAIFAGRIGGYAVTEVAGIITVKDVVTSDGNDGTDKLSNVEVLQFQDGKLFFNHAPSAPVDLDSSTNTVLEGATADSLVGITASASDIDYLSSITYSLVENGGGRFLINSTSGAVSVAPGAAFNADSEPSIGVTVRATDNTGKFADSTFDISVTGSNHAPSDILLSNSAVAENSLEAVVGSISAVDADIGDAHVYLVSDVRFEIVGGVLKLKDGVLLDHEIDPVVPVTVTATDGGGLSFTKTFSIVVTNVNVSGDVAGSVIEDAALSASGSLLFEDPDGGEAGAIPADGITSYGAWAVDVAGNWTYAVNNTSPDVQALPQGATLTDSFVVKSADFSIGQTITITITGANDVPSIEGDVVGFIEEDALTSLLGKVSFLDPDTGESAATAASGIGAHGSWSIDADGKWSYALNPLDVQIQQLGIGHSVHDFFTVLSTDGSANQEITIVISGTNDLPIAFDGTGSGLEDKSITGQLVATDIDGINLAYTLFPGGEPTHGAVVVNSDGSYTYTPNTDFVGTDSFKFEVTDMGGGSAIGEIKLTISGENGAPDSNFRQILTAAPENEWIHVNLNHFQDVWTPKAQRPGSGNWEPDAVIGAWGSMAWDSKRGELICWGGGHANYNGNEVYIWSSSTLEWERASLPSEVEYLGNARYEAIDGYLNAPISSHTYDNSEYLPIIDRFVVFGGAAWNTGGSFVRTDGVTKTGPYFWDPAKADGNAVGGTTGSQVKPELFPDVVGGEMWENRDNLSLSGMTKSFVMGTTAYAQENGKDVLYIGRTDLWKYTVHDINDPASDTFEKVGASFVSISSDGAGAISTDLNVYLRTTKSKFVMWDLDHAGPGNKNVSFVPDDPTGTFDFARLTDYGMDYDPVRGVFILWKGDAEVWTLTPPDQVSTVGWRLMPLTPGAVSEAPDTSTVGVFGKWKYAAEQDMFIGVNDGRNGDVWVYKPHDWNPSNSLPELTLKTSILARHSSSQTRLTDLIDWSDADGDALSFRFTDLNPNATSGYFLLGGKVQNAEQEIAVSAKQLVLGDLLWVNGDGDQSDDITIEVSDPFGSAPVRTIRLPGDPGDPSPSFISSNSETLSDANLADLISASA
jgi:VCBS repeat-containing protein